MIQMALEYGADETTAIRKTAEKCNVGEGVVKDLWNFFQKKDKKFRSCDAENEHTAPFGCLFSVKTAFSLFHVSQKIGIFLKCY